MLWHCAAIKHGVTIFPSGKIGPCCLISADYLKPIESLSDPDRFSDLDTGVPPKQCETCTVAEFSGLSSYRNFFNNQQTEAQGLQFVDIRNTNQCNLKCRYCGPHYSSSWDKELNNILSPTHQSLNGWHETLLTDSLQWMYFAGGEPFLNPDHWDLLQILSKSGRSKNISLMYNTNLTTIRYKDVNILGLWEQFKQVTINCSIDAVGQPLEYIRSGCNWKRIDNNLQLLKQSVTNCNIALTPVISILNIWFLKDLFDYASTCGISVAPTLLSGPDYLALDVMPDSLKEAALEELEEVKKYLSISMFKRITDMVKNNTNYCLFQHTLNHILLLDHTRNEKLFDLLPFKNIAVENILRNHEYE